MYDYMYVFVSACLWVSCDQSVIYVTQADKQTGRRGFKCDRVWFPTVARLHDNILALN